MRIDRGWLAAGFVPVLLAGLLAPTASAAVPLGGGSGITVNGTPCTLATIGHDGSGELVGLTSAHCGGPGAQVSAGGTVGTVVATDDGLDYAVIKFDPANVTPVANIDGFPINGIGPFPPGMFQPICAQSSATGHGCVGVALNLGTGWGGGPLDPASIYVNGCRNPADQGSPVTANGLLIAMVRNSGPLGEPPPNGCRFGYILPSGHIPMAEIVSIPVILDDLNGKGGPGAGFAPVAA